jgi:zinc protease
MRRHTAAYHVLAGGLLLTLAAAPVWSSDNPPPPPREGATVAGITEFDLGNGLRVLLFPDDSKPTVTVNITYLVGSRHEGYGESGMAHLLEHLMFKGTPSHPEIWKVLQAHGAQFNGSTSSDRTNYFETLPATEENLNFALELEADRMVQSFIAQKDLDSEMTVVRNEFEMGENNPLGVLSERIASTAYLWHNYGKSTIGSREDIERVPIERLQAFWRKYYQPDNAVLIVVGKFDAAKTLAKVNDIYGRIPRPARKLEPTYTVEPPQDGEREVVLRRVGDVQALGASYHVCAGSHADQAPLQVLANVLSADQTGRLYKALIEAKLATSVSASADSACEPGLFDVMAEARSDQSLDALRAKMFEVLDTLGQQTFTTEEVDRAKKSFARNFDLLLNDSSRVGTRLSGSVALGDWRLMFLNRDRLEQVTPADVQRVAAQYFKPTNRTVGVFIPTKEPERTTVPPTPDVAALVKDYQDTHEIAAGAAFEATYANIEVHTQRSELPVGMKLALLPKETRGNRVNANLSFHYGSEADLTGHEAAASFLGSMLMRGTTQHTRRELQDRLAELKAQVRVGGGGGGMGGGRGGRGGSSSSAGVLDVSIETTRENLPAVLALVAEVLRTPAFPAEEFEKLQQESLAGHEQQVSEPTVLASNELQRRLNPYPPTNIRYVPTPTEQIERVKAVQVADIVAVYRTQVGASRSEAAFVGDFDPQEVTAQLEKLFGDWRSPQPFQRVENRYQAAAPDTLAIATPDKANAMITLGLPLEIRDDDPEYPALLIANLILGGGSDSRIVNRIRQKEGLAYSCRSSAAVGALDRVGSFTIFSICAPQNAERAILCAREELDRFIKEGVPQAELDDARRGYRQQIEVNLANDGGVAGTLARDLYLGRTLDFSAAQLAKIEALTPREVQAALVKYVVPERLIVIRAGDFGSVAGKAETPSTGG